MIVLAKEKITAKAKRTGSYYIRLFERAAEGHYSFMGVKGSTRSVRGTILVAENLSGIRVCSIGKRSDRVRILIRRGTSGRNQHGGRECNGEILGYVRRGRRWIRDNVMLVDLEEQLFSRFGGLLETDVLAAKRVLVVGLGSGGAPAVVGLVQSGVMHLDLMDPDIVEVGNVMRHVLGLSDVGRFKTIAMAEYLRDKNPFLDIRTWEQWVCSDNRDQVRRLVQEADLVIGATDNQVSKRILNRLCVEEDKVLILAGAFRRAYGGIVQRVRPHKSPCYQCLRQRLPRTSHDQEVSNPREARRLAYTDRPVAIEPGLATDVLPLSTMVVKLAIQELLQGQSTTLRSLDEDLSAPMFLWLNRREAGTEYEALQPLGCHIDGMHPLGWYGAPLPRDPGCDVCGDPVGEMNRKHGITVAAEDVRFFGGDGEGGQR